MPSSAPPPSRWAVAAALFSLYVIWGSTYLAIAIAIETLPPFTMAGVRFLFAGLLLYAVARATGAPRPSAVHWPWAAAVGGLMLAGGNGGVCWAEKRVPSGLASVFIATVPLWAALLDWLRPGGRRPGARVAAGVLLGFAGVALLARPGEGRVDVLGAGVLVAAALSWAAGSVLSKAATLPASPFLATAMEMLAGGALLLAIGGASGEWPRLHADALTTRSVLAVAYLVAFGSLVGFTAFVWLLRVTTPAVATTYAYINPVVALFLGWAVLGEALSARSAVASGVVVAAVALITTQKVPEPKRA